MKRLALLLAAVLLLSTCSAYKAQHGGTDMNRAHTEEVARQTTPPAEASAHFDAQPLAMKQAILVAQLDKYTSELASNGKYDCCVKPGCRECVIRNGECHCRKVIDANGPCCGECTQSWIEGRGNTAGVDREKVLQHLGCVRELYEKKPDSVSSAAPAEAAAPAATTAKP